MTRLEWKELRAYWESHSGESGAVDVAEDEAALGNVCLPGAPLWLNQYLARLQRSTFDWLLAQLPPPRLGERALDVGCGSARWSKLLHERGYDVVGIDLQPVLVELSRQRYPGIRFERAAVQEFSDCNPFDLVCSVTVIQHNPFEEQAVMAGRMRDNLRPGGHAVVLENTRDQVDYVFSRDIAGWVELFQGNGFELRAHRPYEYSPFVRSVTGVGHVVGRVTGVGRDRHTVGAGRPQVGNPPAAGGWLRRMQLSLLRLAVALDYPVERMLAGRGLDKGAVHCGFLFRAV